SSAFASVVLGQSPTPGLNALPEVEFSRLSQRDPNPLGEKALAIHPEQWKHGETEHFIYHFVDGLVVTPLSVEAEFHYRVVAKAHSQAIGADNLIPLPALTAMTYPPSDRVETFYDESERLVRFLASTDKASFLAFLDAVARHQPVDSALVQNYNGKFLTLMAL